MNTLQDIVTRANLARHSTRSERSSEPDAASFDALLLDQLENAEAPDEPSAAAAPDAPAERATDQTAAPDASVLPLWLASTPPAAQDTTPLPAPDSDRTHGTARPGMPIVTETVPPMPTADDDGARELTRPALPGVLAEGASLPVEIPSAPPLEAPAVSPVAALPAPVTPPINAPLAVDGPAPSILPLHGMTVATTMGHSAWADDFSRQVTWLIGRHEQQAELHLNPPQLGPIEISINLKDDQASALFVVTHAPVREAIEQALPKLREMLADNGIMLGNATVSDQPPREQREETGNARPGTTHPATSRATSADHEVASIPLRVLPHGRVDLYA